MEQSHALETLSNLNVVDAHGEKLRHQPLVLLHAIERVRLGGPRWVRFDTIRRELTELLGALAHGAKRPDPGIPVNVLTRPTGAKAGAPARLWEIENYDDLAKAATRPRDVSSATLSEYGSRVGLSEEFDALLRADVKFRDRAVGTLLDTYFPEDDRESVLARVRSAVERSGGGAAEQIWRIYCREGEGGDDYAVAAVSGGFIALGGSGAGPVTRYRSRRPFVAAFCRPEAHGPGGAKRAGEIWRLHREVREGDWVLLPSRDEERVHIGRFGRAEYEFKPNDPACRFSHRWKVGWLGHASYADAREVCGRGVLARGAVATLPVKTADVERLLAKARAEDTPEARARADRRRAVYEEWAERARRTAGLARAGYDFASERGGVTWKTTLALCRLTWITRGRSGEPDPLGAFVPENYWRTTLLPGVVELFGLPPTTGTLEAAATEVEVRTGGSVRAESIRRGTGFVNFYNAFRGSAGNWLRSQETAVLDLLQAARGLRTNEDGRALAARVATLPPVPRGRGKVASMDAAQLLTPVLACLDPRGRFPILNGARHVRGALQRLGVADASLADQYDAMVAMIAPSEPLRRDAFALDMHGVGQGRTGPRRPRPSLPISAKPVEEKDLQQRDIGDIIAIVQGGRRRVRRLHNEMTNALLEARVGASPPREGASSDCLYDALIEKYDGKRDLLIEVKSTTERGVLRLAVGQLLDYRRGVPRPAETDLAVLLPERPDVECEEFLKVVEVKLLWFERRTSGALLGDWVHAPATSSFQGSGDS